MAFSELNDSQKKAVETTEGYVRVIAGAGSGKTRALTHRFAYLVNELGILPSSILCVTFTNKSANEMRSRIHSLIGDSDTGYISTFHGFCNTILLEESHAIHFPKSFLVLDNSDIDGFLQKIYDERGLTSRQMTFSKARDMFEIRKIKEEPGYCKELIGLSLEQLHEKYRKASQLEDILFYGYLYHQKKNFALDYNDLIILTLHIFKENPQIADKWKQRLEYIMIDEFQDIDGLQYDLMRELCEYHHNLFVVGDPDQTIYTWRGARVGYLLDFDKNFPGVQTIFMNENYRSTPQILKAANALISKNRNRLEKNLISMQPSGSPVRAMHYESTEQEAGEIVKLIGSLVKKGYRLGDITLMYRAHYMSRSFENAFLKEGIPYTIYSGVQFFQRKEVKDILSYLRFAVYKDDMDFVRIVNEPKRNIGKTRMAFLEAYAQQNNKSLYQALLDNLETDLFASTQARQFVEVIESADWQSGSVSQLLAQLMDKTGYENMLRLQGAQERLDNLAELKQAAYEYEQSCGEDLDAAGYLAQVALFSASDQVSGGDKVKMMTIHTAKGLEFPVVILAGMTESMFPSRQCRTLEQMEEERRLAFVASTRARERLFFCETQGRLLKGGSRYPSRFLLDIGAENLVWEPQPDAELLKQTRHLVNSGLENPELLTQSQLQVGDKVRHKVFGEGIIMETDPENLNYLVHFESLNTQRRLSFKAKLEKIGSSDFNGWMN